MLDRVEVKYRPYELGEVPVSNPQFAGYINDKLEFGGIDLRDPKKVGSQVVVFELSRFPQSTLKSNLESLKDRSAVITVFYQESVITSEPKIDLVSSYRNEKGEVESRNLSAKVLSEGNPEWWRRFRGWFENKLQFFKPR